MSNSESRDREYNPRWKGYLGIIITSLANFASIADVEDYWNARRWSAALSFGPVTFGLSLIILIFDRTGWFSDKFDFKNVKDGNVEGISLFLFMLWWISGVAVMTRAGGIAYSALNIYASSWLSLFMCIYTLNEWSASKDIVSIQELTHLSATLKSWWVVFLASLVEMGSAAYAHSQLKKIDRQDAAFAVAIGAVSTFVSLVFILTHYKLVTCCRIKNGGALELSVSLLLNLWFIIGLASLTKNDAIASTITGSTIGSQENIPGSNLYMSLWIGFIASCFVTIRWKEAQAMKFAQAQERKDVGEIEEQRRNKIGGAAGDDAEHDEDAI